MAIKVLDQLTINKIAAGEVIERPSSVVKELVENAIDAKANAITVEIKEGGISFIRITDNGEGFEKADIPVAFLRHSTSKIKSVEDLLTVSSLGFRGEALSSISAVAQVELITKTHESLMGTRYVIEGGKEKEVEAVGCPDGTTFIIRNLFYNTPARRKFLKAPVTEGGYIAELIEKLAMSHPDISFRFINNGQNKIHTAGNGNVKDIVYHVYGREINANLLPVHFEADKFSIGGFVGKPVINRGNRNYENYYINGRYIRSNIINKAIEDAYKPFMMQHKYPFTALHFRVDQELIDVNVHPTKMELRFSNGQEIYDAVYESVTNALTHKEFIPSVNLNTEKQEQEEKKERQVISRVERTPEPFEKNRMSQQQMVREATSYETKTIANTPIVKTEPKKDDSAGNELKKNEPTNWVDTLTKISPEKPAKVVENAPQAEIVDDEKNKAFQTLKAETVEKPEGTKMEDVVLKKASNEVPATTVSQPTGNLAPIVESKPSNNVAPTVETKPTQMTLFEDKLLDEKSVVRHKIIGQVFDTYWIVEFDEKMYIIDQHAAHEKVLYERIMARFKESKADSQNLMPAVIVTLSLNDIEVLKENMETFRAFGYEVEEFGGQDYAITAVPLELYGLNEKDVFLEILDELSTGSHKTITSITDRMATIACKAAVKGNNKLSVLEAKELINELLTLENPYNCPHGRPTIVSMSKYEMEKKFKRIV